MKLEQLKIEYKKLQDKWKLPSFKEINEDFEIDKIRKESDNMLRVIRKAMIDKIVNSINFLEMLVNPVNAPRIYHQYIKSMSSGDRKVLEKLYENLGMLTLDSLDLEIIYDEKREIALIKKIFQVWKDSKADFATITAHIRNPEKAEARKEKSYFG